MFLFCQMYIKQRKPILIKKGVKFITVIIQIKTMSKDLPGCCERNGITDNTD